MHPILARAGRLGIYLLGSTPFACLQAFLLHASGRLSWTESAALAFPFCLIYAFVSLSAWYVCRVTPLRTATGARLLSTHGMAALAARGLMLLVAQAPPPITRLPPDPFHPPLP